MTGSTGFKNMRASGSLVNVFSTSLHFFSLIGVACTTTFFCLAGVVARVLVEGTATSFSFPFADAR